jgi:AmpE protein
MALRLFAILIALLLCHLLPQLARWRDERWFRAWAGKLSDSSGASRVAIVLLAPTMAVAILAGLLATTRFLDVLWLLLAVASLCYALGPGDLDRDIDAALQAADPRDRDAALARLSTDGEPIAWSAGPVVEATFFAALRRRFGVLFWFVLLGPAGAVLYRLAQALSFDVHIDIDARTRAAARRFAEALDWLPAHLMVFAMALVSDFDAVIGAWRRWHASAEHARGQLDPSFLGAVAHAGVDADIQAGDGFAQDVSDPLEELRDAKRVTHRVLAVWLALIAVLVLAGWAA